MSQHYPSPSANPYAAPVASVDAVENPEATRDDDLRAFVGSKADYYLRHWATGRAGAGQGSGFNWAAFFLSGLWLPYRKMYLVTAIFYGAILIESVIEELLFVGLLGRPEAPAAIGHLVGFAAAGICGVCGNRWYLSHARSAIAEVRARLSPTQDIFGTLSRRGGTNLLASLGFFLLFLAITSAVFIGLELLLHPET